MKKLLTIFLLLTGCVHQHWSIGLPVDDVIARNGAPDKETVLSDGKKVYTWIIASGNARYPTTCRVSYLTGDQIILQRTEIGNC